MGKKTAKHQVSAVDEVRRHVRVFVDPGRITGECTDYEQFLDQVVVQVARAVEIDHVKVSSSPGNRLVSCCRLRVERGRRTLSHLVGRTKVAARPRTGLPSPDTRVSARSTGPARLEAAAPVSDWIWKFA